MTLAEDFLADHGGDRIDAAVDAGRGLMRDESPTHKNGNSIEYAVSSARELFGLSPTEVVIVRGLLAGRMVELEAGADGRARAKEGAGFVERLGDELAAVAREDGNPRTGWKEYDAAVYLLRTPLLAARSEPFVAERSIDFTGLFGAMRPWSHGEQILVRAAWSLWRGASDGPEKVERDDGTRATLAGARLGEIVWTLDTANVERVLEAIRIYCSIGAPA